MLYGLLAHFPSLGLLLEQSLLFCQHFCMRKTFEATGIIISFRLNWFLINLSPLRMLR